MAFPQQSDPFFGQSLNSTDSPTFKAVNLTPATMTSVLTQLGYHPGRVGTAFIRSAGAAMDSLSATARGQAMCDAFSAALAEPETTAITYADRSVDLGIRAAAKITAGR